MKEQNIIPEVLKSEGKPVVTPDMIPEDRKETSRNKVLFINPPIRLDEPPRHIPYGLAQLMANLDLAGYDVGLLDVNIHRELIDWDLFKDAVTASGQEEWGFIGIGGLVTTYAWQKSAFKVLRKMFPTTPLVAGGGCFTSLETQMLTWNPDIDIGVVGEADVTILELADWLINHKGDPHNINGILFRKFLEKPRHDFESYRKKRGWLKPIKTEPRALLKQEELDRLPYPYLTGVELKLYFANSMLPLSPMSMRCKRRIDVISERGCPHRCSFCFHNGMGEGMVRFQSPTYIVNMISYWRYKYGIDFVSFLDENLTTNRKRCLELCDLMDNSELNQIIYWGCLGRVDNVDQRLLERMHQCGCVYISYGGESGSQKVLDSYRKKTTPDQMKEAIQATISAEINPVMTFMVGAPDEDIEDLLKTVKFWVDNGITCQPFFVTPYPKTELFNQEKDRILKQYNGNLERFVISCGDATKFTANISHHFNDAELIGLRGLMAELAVERIIRFGTEKYGWSKTKEKKLKRLYMPRYVEPFSTEMNIPPALQLFIDQDKEMQK